MRFDLFSSGRLYAALEQAGYADLPAKRTLQDWIKNDSAPESARQAVAEILGTTKEAAPPQWAERLMARVDEIYEAQTTLAQSASKAVIEALAPEVTQEAASGVDARIASAIEPPPRSSDEPVEDQADEPAGGSPGSRQRKPK